MTTKTLPDLGESFEVTGDITKRDIKAGVKGDCHKCAAALAFRRALEKLGFEWAEVTGSLVIAGVGDPDCEPPYYASGWDDDGAARLRAFTILFDTHDEVNPAPDPRKITVTMRLCLPDS